MEKISLRLAKKKDKLFAITLDYNLNQVEHIELKREKKINDAILNEECYIICTGNIAVGFVIFDYRFFDQGWIELIIVNKEHRGKGIAGQAFEHLCNQCETNKIFTSTNESNTQMKKALVKANFTFAGKLEGLDDGDPELFFYKKK